MWRDHQDQGTGIISIPISTIIGIGVRLRSMRLRINFESTSNQHSIQTESKTK